MYSKRIWGVKRNVSWYRCGSEVKPLLRRYKALSSTPSVDTGSVSQKKQRRLKSINENIDNAVQK